MTRPLSPEAIDERQAATSQEFALRMAASWLTLEVRTREAQGAQDPIPLSVRDARTLANWLEYGAAVGEGRAG